MPWEESASRAFTARHETQDADDVAGVLELLESTRDRLAAAFPSLPGQVTVVVHPSRLQLALAQPSLPLLRRMTAPAARRYMVGWFRAGEVHVLAPRLLAARASQVPGSREMNLLAPAALYARLVVGHNNPRLPPPSSPANAVRQVRWAWLAAGAPQFFSGQTGHARPAIARRLRESPAPRFPPGLRDAQLLGGTVFDLLARERGIRACVALACSLPPGGPRAGLVEAFGGRELLHSEGAWRSHLAGLAGRER